MTDSRSLPLSQRVANTVDALPEDTERKRIVEAIDAIAPATPSHIARSLEADTHGSTAAVDPTWLADTLNSFAQDGLIQVSPIADGTDVQVSLTPMAKRVFQLKK